MPFVRAMIIVGLSGLVVFRAGVPRVHAGGIDTLLVIEPSEQYPRHSEGDVIELKNGQLCLVYSRFSGGSGDNAKADIVARRSEDEGKTWSSDRVLVKNEGGKNVMSVSIRRLADGSLLLFYLRKNSLTDCNMYVRRSTDELKSLSDPVRVTMCDGYNVVNNDRVIQLSSGRLIVPAGLHISPDDTWKNFNRYGRLRVYISDDQGRSWRADRSTSARNTSRAVMFQEPGLVEGKNGRLMMYIRTNAGTQYECFSTDDGEHWSKPEPGPLVSPQSPATIERIPWTGDLLCIWNDHSGWHAFPKGKRTPLCLATSSDDGRTWSKSRVIEGDPEGWYCYTSMTFIKDRLILAYCAGDPEVGGLNRLKVVAIARDWLYPKE